MLGFERGEVVDLVAKVVGDAREFGRQQLRVLDGLGEGDSRAHGLRVNADVHAVLGRNVLAQPIPAADDLHSIVQLQFIAAIPNPLVQHLAHVQLIDGDHQHLVVGEKVALHGLVEAQPVELGAEGRRVIHREHLHVRLFRLALAGFGIDAWRRGHVKPLAGLDIGVVVNAHEGGVIFARCGVARCAMGLVAHHQVELDAGLLLSLMHHLNGLVGREDHSDGAVVLRLSERPSQLARVRGCRVRQLVDAHVLFIAAGLAVRAHSEAAQRHCGVGRPCTQGLRQQGNRRNKEEDVLPRLHHLFGDDERGVGLAGAASHDELATVVVLEALEHVGQGLALMLTRVFLRQLAELVGLFDGELRPVDGGCFQVLQGHQLDRDGLVFQRVGGVLAEVGRGHDQALGEAALARQGEEVAKVAQGDRRVVELALDRAVALFLAQLGHQVDAGVRGLVAHRLTLGPVLPEPHVREQGNVLGIELEVGPHQPLEAVAEVAVEGRLVAVLLEDVSDHGFFFTGCAAPASLSLRGATL